MRILPFSIVLAAFAAVPASSALPIGAGAPDFRTVGAIGGKSFKMHLAAQLKKGPVVLYFYPKAFTQGCTLEARAFSEAMPEFRKAGASVIGMSADDMETLKRFSTEECRSAFPVAIASRNIAQAYDVVLKQDPLVTKRTSFVISKSGRIVMVHDDMNWAEHVAKTLAAVRELNKKG